MEIPCVGIWGPTDPRQWAPPDPNSSIIIHEEIECHPCFKDGRFPDCSHMKCMTSITVDDVWNHLKLIVNNIPRQISGV
jgi:ADP-heptose:LPS heptosyltransferase